MKHLLIWIFIFTLPTLACGMQAPATRNRSDSQNVTNAKKVTFYENTQIVAETSTVVMVVTGDLNYRTGAGTEFTDEGDLHEGDTVTCTDFDTAKDGSIWCKHQYGWSNVRWLKMPEGAK